MVSFLLLSLSLSLSSLSLSVCRRMLAACPLRALLFVKHVLQPLFLGIGCMKGAQLLFSWDKFLKVPIFRQSTKLIRGKLKNCVFKVLQTYGAFLIKKGSIHLKTYMKYRFH